jgi:hypothetical protein
MESSRLESEASGFDFFLIVLFVKRWGDTDREFAVIIIPHAWAPLFTLFVQSSVLREDNGRMTTWSSTMLIMSTSSSSNYYYVMLLRLAPRV